MSKRRSPQNAGLAALYTRISRDPEGARLGVERQRKDLTVFAEERGLQIVARFEDNDIGASTRSTKRRPEYDAMLRAARAGQFDTIVAYTSSRLTRRPRENEDLIELAEKYGVCIVYRNSPGFDLTTADGQTIARILAANDAGESVRISERVKRAAQERAEKGLAHGGRVPFGFEMVDGQRAHHAEHARWIREAAKRVLAGETMYGIARDWNSRGRTTNNGVAWNPRQLKRVLTSPATAGLREHDGKLISATAWKPLLKQEDWERVRAVLGTDMHEPRPFSTGRTAAKYTLSGLARCGLCDHRLGSMPATKGGAASFYCPTATGGCGRIRIAMAPLEKWVTAAVLDYIDSDAFRAAAARRPGPDLDAQRDLASAIERAEAALLKADDDHADGVLDDVRYRRQVDRLTARIKGNRVKLAALAQQDAGPDLPNADVVRRGWARHGSGSVADNAWRRSVLGLFVESVTIAPHPTGVPVTLSRRRGESDIDLQARRDANLATVLGRRVSVGWRVA